MCKNHYNKSLTSNYYDVVIQFTASSFLVFPSRKKQKILINYSIID